MVMHARSGGNIEVMGLLLGKVDANVMVHLLIVLQDDSGLQYV